MLIANVEYQGQPRVALSQSPDDFVDLTTSLQVLNDRGTGGPDRPAQSIQDLLDSGQFQPEIFCEMQDRVTRQGHSELLWSRDQVRLKAPFARPGQIIALARNYSAHSEESILPPPKEPNFFCKANTSVIGPGEAILLPPDLGEVEPEIELAFALKKQAWRVPADRVHEYIAGYTILNDVSAQELQRREIQENYPLFRCKSLKTFTPIGPGLRMIDDLGTNPSLKMSLRIDGETRVESSTDDLIFGIPYLIEFISHYLVLEAGDIITTGCPKAAGPIHPGEMISLEIENIGVLENPVAEGKEISV